MSVKERQEKKNKYKVTAQMINLSKSWIDGL